MKIVHEEVLISAGSFPRTKEGIRVLEEVREATAAVVWPPGSSTFSINPVRKRNGVKPIKEGCMIVLREKFGWSTESPILIRSSERPGKVDALRKTSAGDFVVEWETGNISSSHRALNKITLGLVRRVIAGGVLILPTRPLYQYLTDRVGNYEELRPYFLVWKNIPVEHGFLLIIAVEHDAIDSSVPFIQKGTDGRALV